MTSVRRWCVVALVAALVVGVPAVLRWRPVGDVDVSTTQLVERVRASAAEPWSGYAETTGTVQLPVEGDFGDVASLFGAPSRLRVWWDDDRSWRVDRLLVAGESDLVHDGDVTTAFDYERAEAVTTRDPDIRLPRTSDVVPATVARTVLDGVADDEVSAIDPRRVAGVDAAGLRVEPASDATTIDHVDLWVDPDTGVALAVEVYADGSTTPDFTSTLAEYDAGAPDPEHLRFDPAATVSRDFREALDLADAANQYAPFLPPSTAGGLPRTDAGTGAVAVYGAGVTRLVAVPLRDREAGPLRDQLLGAPGATVRRAGTVVAVGPLGVLLTGDGDDGGWLFAGTVTPATLAAVARDVLSDDYAVMRDSRGRTEIRVNP